MGGCFARVSFPTLWDVYGLKALSHEVSAAFGIDLHRKPEWGPIYPTSCGELLDISEMCALPRYNVLALSKATNFDPVDIVEAEGVYHAMLAQGFSSTSLTYHFLSRSGMSQRMIHIVCSSLKPDEVVHFPVLMGIIGIFDTGSVAEKLAFIFSIFDYNQSGVLSYEEVLEIITMVSGSDLDEQELDFLVDDIFAAIDENGDGEITFTELLQAYPLMADALELHDLEEQDGDLSDSFFIGGGCAEGLDSPPQPEKQAARRVTPAAPFCAEPGEGEGTPSESMLQPAAGSGGGETELSSGSALRVPVFQPQQQPAGDESRVLKFNGEDTSRSSMDDEIAPSPTVSSHGSLGAFSSTIRSRTSCCRSLDPEMLHARPTRGTSMNNLRRKSRRADQDLDEAISRAKGERPAMGDAEDTAELVLREIPVASSAVLCAKVAVYSAQREPDERVEKGDDRQDRPTLTALSVEELPDDDISNYLLIPVHTDAW